MRNQPSNLAESFEGLKSGYAAARRSRFRRVRVGNLAMGSGADYHYAIQTDFLRILEDARDMDRNDAVVPSIVDRAVDNMIQDGMTVDPATGDEGADQALRDRWKDWNEDPDQCDDQQESNFAALEWLTCRHMLLDGDIFSLPLKEGCLQQVEAHRARRPANTTRNVVHGVMLDDRRRRVEYWFTKDIVSPLMQVARVSDIQRYPARDSEGNKQVLHVYNPRRMTQTRGVSALAPVFDFCGMFEDINFAKMVQQQIVSCFAVFRQRDVGWQASDPPGVTGASYKDAQWDGSERFIEGIGPGMQVTGQPGEKLEGFSPSVPNETFFPHMRLILTIIGINLGLPLVVALLDASETNFSGFRGAIDQARMGWRRNQASLVGRFHRPVWQWKVRQWLVEDPALRAAAKKSGVNIFSHRWTAPKWPYIDPLKDASFDLLRQRNCLASPSDVQAERGGDWNELSTRIVNDHTLAIRKAKKAAAELNKEFPGDPPVHWRELLSLPTPDGVQVSLSGTDETAEGKTQAAGDDNAGKPQPRKASRNG